MDRRFDLVGSVLLYRLLQPMDHCPVRDGRR